MSRAPRGAGNNIPAPSRMIQFAYARLTGGLTLRTFAVTGLVIAAAVPVLVASVQWLFLVDPGAFALMLGLVLLAELGELDLFDRSSFSVGLAPIVAAALLLGVPGATLIAPSSVLWRGIRRKTHWYKVGFNVATQALAGAAAAVAAQSAHTPLATHNLLLLLLPAGLAGAAYYLTNTSLTAAAMASDLRLSPVRAWTENFGWLWPQYLGLSLMGLLVAVANVDYGLIGVAAFVLPPLMMRYVAKQYVDRTQKAVQQLRTLNQDLSEEVARREQSERSLQHQALHDFLTGLPNRSLLADRVQQAVAASRRDGRPLALLLMDLDRFKEVNDTFGHHHGDIVLQEMAKRLTDSLRESDTIARLGGDEFAILLPLTDREGAVRTTRMLLHTVQQPLTLEGRSFATAASVGIALFPEHGDDALALLRHADVAMYAAKRDGTGSAVYAAELDHNSPDRLALVGELRRAIEQDELLLHYQPKSHIRTGEVVGVEALVRWRHPERGVVSPGEFIGVAEDTGLIRPLSLWVLETALRQCRTWQNHGYNLSVAVNLSMRNLHDHDLPEIVSEQLSRAGVAADSLVIEITESTLMADPERALDIVERLSTHGVRIAIDDFGTGYSSLSYLTRLPVSELKIDQSFVRRMLGATNEAAIVRSTVGLAHDLGLMVVAEGIENAQTWEVLSQLGCDVGQGYHISRPRPADELTKWLSETDRRYASLAAA